MKHSKLIKLIAALRSNEIREIRKTLKKEKEQDLLQTFDLLLSQVRKGKVKDSESFILKHNLPQIQFPYVVTHRLQNFILNNLTWTLLNSHKTHKLLLQILHAIILYNRGLENDAKELMNQVRTRVLSLGHPSLMTTLAFYISIQYNDRESLKNVISLWKTATSNQSLIVKSSLLFSQVLKYSLGVFAKRDLSNLSVKTRKAIKHLLSLQIPRGYLPAYVILIRKHDVLFYTLGRFDISRRLLPHLDKQSKILTSVYQPEIRAAILARLIRQAVIEADTEKLTELISEAKTIINNPSLAPEWKINLSTKHPYIHQITGEIDKANKTIKQLIKNYRIKNSITMLKEVSSINDLLEIIFMRINNNFIARRHPSLITRDLNLYNSIISKLDNYEYDKFFDLLYVVCKTAYHKSAYWNRQLKKVTNKDDALKEFGDLIIEWNKEEFKREKYEKYLRRLKDIVWNVPGIGHILSILNIPGWILRETMPPDKAERTGRMLTKKFLGL